jgi:hypothetical protein
MTTTTGYRICLLIGPLYIVLGILAGKIGAVGKTEIFGPVYKALIGTFR